MPVPLHAALREDLRPQQANSERSLLEQRARIALADERRQRRHHDDDGKRRSRSGTEWNSAALRAACVVGLVLVVLCALASKASALPGSRPQATGILSGEMRSGGGQVVANGGMRGSGHHYTGHQLGQYAAIQPSASAHHYTGHQIGQRAAIQVRASASQPSETFDWADASVGAGFTIMVGVIIVGGVLVASRRRGHRQLTAGSSR